MTDNPTPDRLRAIMQRLDLTQSEMAWYLGVPRGTLGNWLQGTREIHGCATRLLDVLGTVEWAAPALHEGFKPKKGAVK